MRHVLALLGLAILTACGADLTDSETMFRISDTSGSIQVPLVGVDAAGRKYQLRGAIFEVSGTALLTLSDTARAKSLSTPLPMGGYQMYLRPGYEVVEVGADGSERAVPAVLSSANPAQFNVEPRTSGRLRLMFRDGDTNIAFGGSEAAPRVENLTRAASGALAAAR